MAFEALADKLSAAFKKLKSRGRLSEADLKIAMREVRLALLEADVNYKVAKNFINNVTEKAIGSNIMESLTPAQMVIKIVNEELTELFGGTESRLKIPSSPPAVFMLCGLQGSGKTTHATKLALMLKKQGHRPIMVACDIYRPAAITQLQVMGEKVGVPVFEKGTENPIKIAKEAIKYSKDHGYDIVIIDTAGRLHIDEQLMNELKDIKQQIVPHEVLFVVDSMTGQDAVTVAKAFDDALGIDGVILTKLDGDTRGGAALSVRSVTGKPIKFIGVGEKVEDIEPFHPSRMASRILGMGDVLSLIEQAETQLDEKKADEMLKKIEKNKVDYNLLLDQIYQIKKMGPLKKVLGMLPGMDKQLKDVDIDERQIDHSAAIILSMTKKEREKPDLMNASRKRRIAAGSGLRVEDVNKLIKQFEQTQKMMKQFGGKKGMKNLQKMGGPLGNFNNMPF